MNTVTIPANPDRPTLFDAQPQRALTLKEQWAIYHTEHPEVYRELERMTQEMVDRGRTKLSIKTLVEVLRWNYYMRTDANYEFKVNNSHSAFYSRLLMAEHPEWGNIFELREVHESRGFLVRKKEA